MTTVNNSLPAEESFQIAEAFSAIHCTDDGPFIVAETNGRLLTVMDCDLNVRQARALRDWLNKVLP